MVCSVALEGLLYWEYQITKVNGGECVWLTEEVRDITEE